MRILNQIFSTVRSHGKIVTENKHTAGVAKGDGSVTWGGGGQTEIIEFSA